MPVALKHTYISPFLSWHPECILTSGSTRIALKFRKNEVFLCAAFSVEQERRCFIALGLGNHFSRLLVPSPTPLRNRIGLSFWTYLLPSFFFFFFFLINLFIYFWLCWVFVAVHKLSLVVVSGGYSSLRCTGFSLSWLLLLWSMGSRRAGFSSCGSPALELRLSNCSARA